MANSYSLDALLKSHYKVRDDARVPTHTRIGSSDFNIKGGSYYFEDSELPVFWKSYYDAVFVNKRREYLTERQIVDGCSPLLIDLDFKYAYEIETRQHTDGLILDIILKYIEVLRSLVDFDESQFYEIFVMQKSTVNRVMDKGITKDGIHIIFGIQLDIVTKQILRNRMMPILSEVLKCIPIINSIDDVIDFSICRGSTNWQVYGSRKPACEPYLLTQKYNVCIHPTDVDIDVSGPEDFDLKTNIQKLSARYGGYSTPTLTASFVDEHTLFTTNSKPKPTKVKTESALVPSFGLLGDYVVGSTQYQTITNAETLAQQVNSMMSALTMDEYYIKETHDYAQILPERFYRAGGSHDENTKLAFALKNTDDRLFLSWVMVRSKSEDFVYSDIPMLRKRWDNSFNKCRDEMLTRRSIIYWAKQENPAEYQRILEQTTTYYLDQSLLDGSDWDLAMVVYQLYKDRYICANTENKVWYNFANHKWTKDQGATLRVVISTEVYKMYKKKLEPIALEKQAAQEAYELTKSNKKDSDVTPKELLDLKDKLEEIKLKFNKIMKIIEKLKNTPNKNHIIVEAASLFYDADFIKRADANPNLLCFSNGVWDFTANLFRPGIPQDYITKSTNIPYIQEPERDHDAISQIQLFMQQLFVSPGLNRYMWDHLSSCLVGGNKNQTFNMYIGCGSNGKSKLTDLMSRCFGDYKGAVPISLVTDKRPSIGGTASEIINLKGIRYAVMQEPTKSSCVLNEGVMKEMTGSDPITARGLYQDSETFIPQLTLVVCSNILFDINSTDNGTWRRIRICKFGSKFVDPDEMEPSPGENIFARDCDLDSKIQRWAPTFMSMLVTRYLSTRGKVLDCEDVLVESKKYRDRENHLNTFITELLEEIPTEEITKKSTLGIATIYARFKSWFGVHASASIKAMPKRTELDDALTKKWKKGPGGWNLRFKMIENDEAEHP
jgi:P4 family phage/plasmid primase-like protien